MNGENTEKGGRQSVKQHGNALWWRRNFLCGVLLGAGAILPGVSGGVLAVVFGVYRPCMEILTHPKRAIPKYWPMLPPLGIGWAVGFLLLVRGIAAVIRVSETVTTWLFIGLIVGTIPALFREAGKEGRTTASWVSLIVCALSLCAGLFYVRHVLRFEAAPNFWWYNFCGVLMGIGVVLPGFSASPVMMALGLYQPLVEDMSRMDLGALASCLPGAALTVLLLARVMNWLFLRHHSTVSHGILGVVAASTLAVIPSAYTGPGEMFLSALCCCGGFLLAFFMDRMDRRSHMVTPP